MCLFQLQSIINVHALLLHSCCCAEWVDEGLSVHVKFNVPSEGTAQNVDPLVANDVFVHYFAESELDKYNHRSDSADPVPFDGLSCKAFKLDKLKMGQQAQRIAAFEERNKK
jgi:hypothetical protein